MRAISRFSLERLPEQDGNDARARLLDGERVVLEDIDGVELAHQFEGKWGWLLFITYDCPFDEGLHIVLLGADLKLLDEVRVGFMYPEGIGLLEKVAIASENEVTFDFYGSWRLEVDERGWVGPGGAPRGVERPWKRALARRHLRLAVQESTDKPAATAG